MIASIHQPNFMPWYPFFQKMAQSDVFVILKECQFEKNNFQNRFNMGDLWHTMSVNKGLEPIKNKRYVSHERDWSKIKKRLHKYDLTIFDDAISESLLETNVGIIKKIKSMLNLRCEVVLDSPSESISTDRLIEICKKHGATTYIAGTSGKKYMDIDKFTRSDLRVEFQCEGNMIKKPILEVLGSECYDLL